MEFIGQKKSITANQKATKKTGSHGYIGLNERTKMNRSAPPKSTWPADLLRKGSTGPTQKTVDPGSTDPRWFQSLILIGFSKDYFEADIDIRHQDAKCNAFDVSDMIYHKLSHGTTSYTLSGENVNVMLELLLSDELIGYLLTNIYTCTSLHSYPHCTHPNTIYCCHAVGVVQENKLKALSYTSIIQGWEPTNNDSNMTLTFSPLSE